MDIYSGLGKIIKQDFVDGLRVIHLICEKYLKYLYDLLVIDKS